MRYDINNKAIPETYDECTNMHCKDCVNNSLLIGLNPCTCNYRKLLDQIKFSKYIKGD